MDMKSHFGHIEGLNVSDWWISRHQCSIAGVHIPLKEALHCVQGVGCYSILLFNKYVVEIDNGLFFVYVVMDTLNAAALKINQEARLPVRVVRGDKLENPYAPRVGYRYEGLYVVDGSWTCTNFSTGFNENIFLFTRLNFQAPPPWCCGISSSNYNQSHVEAAARSPRSILRPRLNATLCSSPKRVTISDIVESHFISDESSSDGMTELNNPFGKMKQTTILNYFLPIEKQPLPEALKLTKSSSYSPKSLRGNRFSPMSTTNIKQEEVPNNNHESTTSKERSRKYSSRYKSKINFLQANCQSAPTFMENLISRRNEQLRLRKNEIVSKDLAAYRVKDSSVLLNRLFTGFDDFQMLISKLRCIKFKVFLQGQCSQIGVAAESSADGFRGFQSFH